MRVHSIEKIRQLKSLRRRGLSINELVSELAIPKTTVWHHIQGVQVLPKYAQVLKAKRGGSTKRFAQGVEEAQKRAEEILWGPYRERAVAIAMLYWGEGHKKSCEFTNSDGKMVEVFLSILRNVFEVPEEAIKPTMRIFDGMDQKVCLSYWSQVTGIPKENFTLRLNDGGTRGRTKYGMCRIAVRKGSRLLKLFHALINQLKDEMLIKPS